jgi:hypothetical protein
VAKKRKQQQQQQLQNFLFFLSFPYLSTRSMYGNGDKYLSDHVPHLLFACSLFRQLSTFLFFPDCQRRSVFVDPKDIQRSPEEESAVNYNNSCKKKTKLLRGNLVQKWCAESASTHVEREHVALRIMETCRAGHCARLGAAHEEFGLPGSQKFPNG